MASDSYLQIDGLKGESTDSAHKDWIEILSHQHTITQPCVRDRELGWRRYQRPQQA